MLALVLVVLLALNALFWGLADHGTHCKLAASVGMSNCSPHYVHLLIGLVSYLAAVGVQQRAYLFG